ncbi:MAG: MBL fold metallo-hydrolase [Bacteroidales bacterium]|nr:MBL fold metallo-hydrolase [Bacteroidales bacterium]
MDISRRIHWLGQAAVRIDAPDKRIYIDPYMITEEDQADYVLITHPHFDHLSVGDIRKVSGPGTQFIAAEGCRAKLLDAGFVNLMLVNPGDELILNGIIIRAVPAYNLVKTNYHPREKRWVGYLITIGDETIYHAGDTERIPEMKTFTCDVALLPLGQTYTMNSVEEAAEAALDVQARVVIPIHYGLYEGTEEDSHLFARLLQGKAEVLIR